MSIIIPQNFKELRIVKEKGNTGKGAVKSIGRKGIKRGKRNSSKLKRYVV